MTTMLDNIIGTAATAVGAANSVTSEINSEAHQILRAYVGNNNRKQDEEKLPGIVHPGATGVIYCTDRAQANGFTVSDPEWANLGQGAPETGDLPGGPPRITNIDLSAYGNGVNEYAPTTGVKELRQAVANLYNKEYRQGMKSQYTYENVCITPGGRAGMARLAAVIGEVFCVRTNGISNSRASNGSYHTIGRLLIPSSSPRYTTYSEVLSCFKNLIPIPTALNAEDKYKLNIEQMRREIKNLSLGVIIASNPRNPTGQSIEGDDLRDLVHLSKDKATIILDEFYSWYQYPDDPADLGTSLSAARYIEDVNEDPVILINGLTKGWRLPGWRVCWVIGPKDLTSAISQSGSFLDGGASHVMQMAAIPLLDPARVELEKISLQKAFRIKRDHVLARLKKMGLEVKIPPQATFYVWLDLKGLEEPINNGLVFFEELLKEKTICVPGLFFDINPSKRRDLFHSPCHHFVRLSFGPPMETLDKGLDAIERVLAKHSHSRHLLGQDYKKSESHKSPGT